MGPPLVRTLGRSLVPAAVLVALAAGWHTWSGVRLEHAAERELARLDLDRPPGGTVEPPAIVAARVELRELLSWVAAVPSADGEPTFGVGHTLVPEREAWLEQGVARRARFYEGLERLPAELWELDGAPPGSAWGAEPSVLGVRAATCALAARAWISARAGDDRAASADLARGLALVRVTDDASAISVLCRRAFEHQLLAAAQGLLETRAADRGVVLAAIRPELERSLVPAPELDLPEAELRYVLQWQQRLLTQDASPVTAWELRPGSMALRLELLELYDCIRRGEQPDLAQRSPEVQQAWRTWTEVGRQDAESRASLAETFAALGS